MHTTQTKTTFQTDRNERILAGTADVDQLASEVKDSVRIDIAMQNDLEAFLADPIGFGDFDYLDPICLVDFEANPRSHGFYIEAIT